MVEKGEQPAIPIPEKIAKDKYYSLNAVKYIAKVIKNFKYGDFAEYRQGVKRGDKGMVQGNNSKNSENGDKDDD